MQSTAEIKPTLSYTIRPIREDEIPEAVSHFNEMTRLEPVEDGTTIGEFTDWYRNPMNREKYYLARLLDTDDSEGRIIGDLAIANHEDGRAWGWFGVHPDFRLNGVGSALFDKFVSLAQEGGSTSMQLVPNSKQNLLVEFLERRGFTLDRYFWDMRLPAEHPVEPPSMPDGFTVRTFVPGQDEELWLEVRNVTFAEHYGSVTRTLDEITFLSREEHFRPEGLFFAFENDKLAGFCFSATDPRECERLGYTIGHIHSLGTMPDYRRRGVGKGLLLHGINYLRQDVGIVSLGVEGKNASALHLYESVGFKDYKSWANMEKKV